MLLLGILLLFVTFPWFQFKYIFSQNGEIFNYMLPDGINMKYIIYLERIEGILKQIWLKMALVYCDCWKLKMAKCWDV